jgi:aminobenzoyl-glutamate utilization protein B
VDYEIIHGLYALLPNEALARAMHASLEQVGGVEYVPLLGDRDPPLDYRNKP